ncbi:MAG TPA: hypothetical protein VK892_23300 [Pyrinomonadaceae bacterium]|nr:hypothetical protein [Pyrinomonadaceae bacterium]
MDEPQIFSFNAKFTTFTGKKIVEKLFILSSKALMEISGAKGLSPVKPDRTAEIYSWSDKPKTALARRLSRANAAGRFAKRIENSSRFKAFITDFK